MWQNPQFRGFAISITSTMTNDNNGCDREGPRQRIVVKKRELGVIAALIVKVKENDVLWFIRVVHGSDGPAGRVGSGRVRSGQAGRVTIFPDFGESGRVSTSDF